MEIQLSKQEKNMSICVAWPKVAKAGRARCFHRAKLLIVVITKSANGNMDLKAKADLKFHDFWLKTIWPKDI